MRGSSAVPDVSFVVITYNEDANIVNCLSSITSQIGAGSMEVLVVDDGSSDRTADVVAEFAVDRPEIVLLQHPFNRGRGAARETGINAARGELIAMVDADIVLPPNWLQCCGAALTDNVDAVGGIPVPDGDVSFLYRRFGMHPRPVPPTVPVTGANGLYRRRVFELVSVDPSLAEGEDIALNHAMARAGLIARNLPDVLVEHHEDKTFLGSLRWLYQSGIGASRQWARYGEVRVPDLAFVGQLTTIGVAVVASRRIDRRLAWAIPSAYLFASSLAHVNRKFEVRGAAGRLALATLTDAVFLGSYFAGRVVGIAAYVGHQAEKQDGDPHLATGGSS